MKKTHLYRFTEEKCNRINSLIQELTTMRGLNNERWKRNFWSNYFLDISEIDFELLDKLDNDQIKLIIDMIRKGLATTQGKIEAFELNIDTLPSTRILIDNSVRCFIAENYDNSIVYLLALLFKLKLDAYECIHENLKAAVSKKGHVNDRGFFIRNKGAYSITHIREEYDSVFDDIVEKEDSFEIYFKTKLMEVIDKWYMPKDYAELKL